METSDRFTLDNIPKIEDASIERQYPDERLPGYTVYEIAIIPDPEHEWIKSHALQKYRMQIRVHNYEVNSKKVVNHLVYQTKIGWEQFWLKQNLNKEKIPLEEFLLGSAL